MIISTVQISHLHKSRKVNVIIGDRQSAALQGLPLLLVLLVHATLDYPIAFSPFCILYLCRITLTLKLLRRVDLVCETLVCSVFPPR